MNIVGGGGGCFKTLLVVRLCRVEWWMMNRKGFGRKPPWPNRGTILTFLEGLRKIVRNLRQDSGYFGPEIQTEHVPNTGLDRYPYPKPFGKLRRHTPTNKNCRYASL
jgi:hypothetical protein